MTFNSNETFYQMVERTYTKFGVGIKPESPVARTSDTGRVG